MNENALNLWFGHPEDLLDVGVVEACAKLLNDDERARWHRLKFASSRRELLATRALVRSALAHHGAGSAAALQFSHNPHGKPAITPEHPLRFNLTNSRQLVACLIGQEGEVGIDMEPQARAGSIVEVAARVFSPIELEQLGTLSGEAHRVRCLHLWTLKEAYMKARGLGFALPTTGFSFLFEGDLVRLRVEDPTDADDPARWRFCLLNYRDHCVALMVQDRAQPELNAYEARPPNASPHEISIRPLRWFP